jgi:hypothetical protein
MTSETVIFTRPLNSNSSKVVSGMCFRSTTTSEGKNDIRREIAADKALINAGWKIKWVVKGYKGISKKLRALLNEKPRIPVEEIP